MVNYLSPTFIMKAAAVRAAIKDANGTFITVKTRCVDGSISVHNGRTGVYRYTLAKNPSGKPRLTLTSFTLWCPRKNGYRTVLVSNVIRISFCKRVQVFEGKGV